MFKNLFILFIILPVTSHSQGWLPMGGRSNSMANATVALSDTWSYHHNPGALAEITNASFGVSYENRFLLRELQSQGLTYAQPVKKGVISFGAQTYGFTSYRTYRVGGGYSMKLSEKLMAGMQMNYQGIRLAENYGSKNTLTAELGVLFHITENWKVGMSVFNIGRNQLAAYADDRFNTIMRLGTSLKVSDKVLVAAEVEKNVDYPIRIKTGMDYEVMKSFYFRAGFATQPIEGTFGFGYKMKSIQLDLGSAYHQQLGWSPHFSLTFLGK